MLSLTLNSETLEALAEGDDVGVGSGAEECSPGLKWTLRVVGSTKEKTIPRKRQRLKYQVTVELCFKGRRGKHQLVYAGTTMPRSGAIGRSAPLRSSFAEGQSSLVVEWRRRDMARSKLVIHDNVKLRADEGDGVGMARGVP